MHVKYLGGLKCWVPLYNIKKILSKVPTVTTTVSLQFIPKYVMSNSDQDIDVRDQA